MQLDEIEKSLESFYSLVDSNSAESEKVAENLFSLIISNVYFKEYIDKFLKDKDHQEEILNLFCVMIWNARSNPDKRWFKQTVSFKNWALTKLKNICIDFLSKKKRF